MPYFGIPIRNGLPIGLGSVAGFGVQQFSPADLFSAGEQGAWYDPSDFSTLFTDSAGTTPVTAVEQFVGLMLDKSKAPNSVAHRYWRYVAGRDIINGHHPRVARIVLSTNTTDTNIVVFTADNCSDQGTIPALGASYSYDFGSQVLIVGAKIYSSYGLGARGSYYSVEYSDDNVNWFTAFNGVASSNGCGLLTNSVFAYAGNHATSTGTKRPKLAARYNLLTYTEQFDNAAWGKSNVTVTANAVIAPNGTTTADRLVTNNGSNALWYLQQIPSIASQSLKFNIFAKADAAFHIGFSIDSGVRAGVNLSTGTITLNDFGITVVGLSDGWYNISWSSTGDRVRVFCSTTAITVANQSVTGDGTSGIYIWGADLRPASQATGLIGPTYQRVVDAATYDAAGYLPYLAFDGIDDSMSTGSIDFTAIDKMTVWAGVRKLSDAAAGNVAELSADINANNGSFVVSFPGSIGVIGPNMISGLRGTTTAFADARTYVAPITGVLQNSFDIAQSAVADEIKQRVNGASPSSVTYLNANCGTGNFGNHALFIGARNNSSLFFQGWLTSLIVRGAQSTQSQIEATESWVNQRTGAY